MTLKKNGTERPDKKDMKFDPEIIFRVENTSDTFEIDVDSEPFITLKFTKSVLKE